MLSFSNDDLEAMNKDVGEIFGSDSSSDENSADYYDNGNFSTHSHTSHCLLYRFGFHSNEKSFSDNSELDVEDGECSKRKRRASEDLDSELPKKKYNLLDDNAGSSTSNIEANADSSSSSSGSSNSSKDDEDEESPADKFRRGEDLPSDLDLGSNDGSADSAGSNENNDDEDDGDWNMMGAALEREFLGMD